MAGTEITLLDAAFVILLFMGLVVLTNLFYELFLENRNQIQYGEIPGLGDGDWEDYVEEEEIING